MAMDIKSLVPGQTKTNFTKTEKSKKKTGDTSAASSAGDADDSVSITGQASKINQLIQQMKSAPVIDPDKVSPVKDKLDKGNYEIEYESVANKMLDFESSFQGY